MMRKKLLELMGFMAISLLWLAGSGCANSAVGDPCVPEAVPEGGFLDSETYLETSSVQCATRVCLVRGLDGDPNNLQEDEPPCPKDPIPLESPSDSTCVFENDVERSVYCSCRCGAPAESGLPTCDCPGGFICEEVLETGGDGLRGSYCVRDPLLEVQ